MLKRILKMICGREFRGYEKAGMGVRGHTCTKE